MTVTPEAAGSSPVDPANYPSETKGFPVRNGSLVANRPLAAERACLQAGENSSTFQLLSFGLMMSRCKEMLALSGDVANDVASSGPDSRWRRSREHDP